MVTIITMSAFSTFKGAMVFNGSNIEFKKATEMTDDVFNSIPFYRQKNQLT